MSHHFLTAACVLATVAVALALPVSAEECRSLYGIHDHVPTPTEYLNKIKAKAGCGWVTATVEVGHSPYDHGGANFSWYSSQGHTVICRINNGYGASGTIPLPSQYDDFATRCANFVAASTGCNTWVIGNETNLAVEWPLNGSRFTYVSPQDYAQCFRKVYNAIKAVRPNDQVVCQALAPWAGPYGEGTKDGLPHDANPLNWVDYMKQMLLAIEASGPLDGIALHVPSRGYSYADIHSTAKVGGYYWSFYVYKDWIDKGTPTSMYDLPMYITESNGMFYWKGGHPEDPSKHYEAGWMQEVYAEINRYNQSAALNGKPIIKCVNMYRWCAYCDGWNIDGSSNPYKAQILSDLDAALDQGYTWPQAGQYNRIIDNSDPGFSVLSGDWTLGTTALDKYGADYRFNLSGTGADKVRWTANLQEAGLYEVAVWYSSGPNRASNAPYTLTHLTGTNTIRVDQQTAGGSWFTLGTFPFAAGSASVTLSDDAGASVVVADAVRWVYKEELPQSGSIAGFVRDSGGIPIPGASIVATPGTHAATSAGNGAYQMGDVPPGTYNVTAHKTGYVSHTISGLAVGVSSAAANFNLVRDLLMQIDSTSSDLDGVYRGQQNVPVAMTVSNLGSRDVRITGATLKFYQNSANVSSGYSVTASAANPSLIPRGTSRTLAFEVDVLGTAPTGTTTIEGAISAYVNLIPNGSFEEVGSVPPNEWVNWNTGGGYALDSSASHGSRSYRFDLTGADADTWVTTSTAVAPFLLPILPSTTYHLKTSYKRLLSGGSASMALVFEEYDQTQNKIGDDRYTALPSSASWTEGGTDIVTSPNAAYFRVWPGFLATLSGTTASAWFDDLRLYDDALLTDTSAEEPDAWVVSEAQEISRIADAKAFTDGTSVTLTGKSCTVNSGDRFWIQEPDRSSAIQIEGAWPLAVPGALIDVTGVITTVSGERLLSGASVNVAGTGEVPHPVVLAGPDVAGPSLNAYTPGVDDALADGVHTVGLYCAVFGRITAVPQAGVLYLDDGSGMVDGSGHVGLRILIDDLENGPVTGQWVRIDGIARLEEIDSGYRRAFSCVGDDSIIAL